ncbi:YlbL family protein [Mycolicibacterium brisbanense]|uniref:endopeptidase La n=1 Tax=Mycolicibacterium brisbanense TaxID=146020 RepID=A0A100W5D6_9MYCO|nr:PDZ domain-containing protein [Mycolicibacterium brisbanense]MCV7156070.1 PDZ domain-containing protein [Mycolicibacterium brisbanense]GAS91919.1 PDZ domain-containing protein [Mycolicibacterium brisbanense]
MNRRILTLLVALVPILVFGVLLSVVTVPYVSLGPGPTFNTLGEVEGKQVVDINSTGETVVVHPTSGHLNMTTVSQRDGLTLGQALTLWMSGREQLVPRDLVYPPDKSKDEIDQANTSDFKRSEDNAEYAALAFLKYPMAVTVQTVTDPGPSAGKLKPGDAIDAVNGKPVAKLDEFQALLKATKPGDTIVLDYRRKNAPAGTATITLGHNPDRDYGFLGVGVLDAPWAPFDISFNLANIGGPSAGLMFSLAVVDKLTTGDLNDGKFIAGTGTITGDGKVGSIGGITHKMLAAHEAGATVFLVPAENCAEARSAPQDGMELVKVDTLTGAVDALHTLSAGGEPPRC